MNETEKHLIEIEEALKHKEQEENSLKEQLKSADATISDYNLRTQRMEKDLEAVHQQFHDTRGLHTETTRTMAVLNAKISEWEKRYEKKKLDHDLLANEVK